MRRLLLLLTCSTVPLAAQTTGPLSRAAQTITEADIMRRVGTIAADSMMGRDTPSPGLERTAEYVASEFQRAGLRPAGDVGSYLQRFAVTRWTVDTSRSAVEFTANGSRRVARIGTDARLVLGAIPSAPIQGGVLLLAGSESSIARVGAVVKDRIILLLQDYSKPISPALNQ
ncbi:MAG TPA: hypothetical protein VGP44_05910, partial [Gemmatimonadales bacterium]|nr:hypothetical protein [Gemmatimonadales bacterium]